MTDAISAAALLVTAARWSLPLVATRRALPAPGGAGGHVVLAASLLRSALDPRPVQLSRTALLVLLKRLALAGVRRTAAARACAPS